MRFPTVLVICALAAAPAVAPAATLKSGRCQVEAPASWTVSGGQASADGGKASARLTSTPSPEDAVEFVTSMGATKVSEGGGRILFRQAGDGGATQYYGVTKTTPACIADVTASGGGLSSAAKGVAQSVRQTD